MTGGTVTAPVSAAAGATVILTANPDTGYTFINNLSNWSVTDASGNPLTVDPDPTGGNTASFVMPAEAVTVTATFTQVTVSITGPSGTTIAMTAATASHSMSVTATGSPVPGFSGITGTYSYQWYSNTTNSNSGGTPVGTDSNSYTASGLLPGIYYYYCEFSYTFNGVTVTATSNAATVTVNPSVTVSVSPAPPVTPGASVTLTAATNPVGGTYQWYTSVGGIGSPIPGATSATCSITAGSAGTSTSYYCVYTVNLRQAESNTATVTVSYPNLVGTVTISSSVSGFTRTLTASVTSNADGSGGTYSYQWIRVSPYWDMGTGPTLNIDTSDASPYRVIVTHSLYGGQLTRDYP